MEDQERIGQLQGQIEVGQGHQDPRMLAEALRGEAANDLDRLAAPLGVEPRERLVE